MTPALGAAVGPVGRLLSKDIAEGKDGSPYKHPQPEGPQPEGPQSGVWPYLQQLWQNPYVRYGVPVAGGGLALYALYRMMAGRGRRRRDDDDYKYASERLPPGKDIVDMDSTGAALADYFTPGAWGGERAGRIETLARAMGEPTTFNVKHPSTHAVLSGLGGGLGGAVIGGGLGGLLGHLTVGGPHGTLPGLAVGSIGGSVLGSLAGGLLSGKGRREEMKRVVDLYDQTRKNKKKKLNLADPELSLLSAIFLPGRGPHRTGQLETARTLRGEKSIDEQRDGFRDLGYLVKSIPYGPKQVMPAVGTAALLHDYLQNIRTQREAGTGKGRSSPG